MKRILVYTFALLVLMTSVLAVKAKQAQATIEVCFCHNVNNNPHTVCTSNAGFIAGHLSHVRNGQDTIGVCKTPSPSPTVSASPTPTASPSATPSSSPVATKTPEPTPFVHQACNTSCVTDQECRDRDGSYVCHLGQCRLEEAPERQECNPRPTSTEEPKGVITVEELRSLPSGNK